MTLRLNRVSLPLAPFKLEIDTVFDQSIIGIFGPSGAGKTSLLELIAGLRRPTGGTVALNGTVLFDGGARINVPSRLRRVGYVPQDLALFPHLNVRKNLLYGESASRTNNKSGPFTLDHVASVMDIVALLERDVRSLSGGEQQRVAFARAILSVPRLLLLDEPMSSLDARLKNRLVPFLLRIGDEFGIPLVYVTHDAAELSSLCDEVAVLEHGRITRRGTPAEVLEINRS